MTPERIQINGQWYVLEVNTENMPNEKTPMTINDCTVTDCISYENGDYIFEATRLVDWVDSPWIIIKNKHKMDPKEIDNMESEEIDNVSFMHGIIDNNPESLEAIEDDFYYHDIELLREFLIVLKTENWI